VISYGKATVRAHSGHSNEYGPGPCGHQFVGQLQTLPLSPPVGCYMSNISQLPCIFFSTVTLIINLLTKLEIFMARYSLIVLKLPLNPSQSIKTCIRLTLIFCCPTKAGRLSRPKHCTKCARCCVSPWFWWKRRSFCSTG